MIVFSDYEKVNAIIHIVIYILSYIGAVTVTYHALLTFLGSPPDEDKVPIIIGCTAITTVVLMMGLGISISLMEWIAS